MSSSRKAFCLCVKNEERDIAEWVAYHLVFEFDAIFVYDNFSTDRTLEVLNLFVPLGKVNVISG
ncbi:glycosyltransferase family 2 protein [Methylacidiphilum caldifontis]|uniref:glycosyltransferase family 2 protein n=1 Tax=Methylacidiphilum caldifontis TaxID=2795386 RepID=UPI001A8D58CA|nr:glycosyltransferase family 2 protein [Methylacidiphilum caldifontis]QSR89274.1 glycosyltransferase family 2 protein [Methylacidiphilum caldifontis]